MQKNKRLGLKDIFLRVDVPEGAELIISAVVAGKETVVRKHPLSSEKGEYKMKVIYSEPGIRGPPVIEFNFDPAYHQNTKGLGMSQNAQARVISAAMVELPLLLRTYRCQR